MGTARRGRALLTRQLESRGATVREIKEGRLKLLEVTSPRVGNPVRVRVKTRQSGTWQLSVSDGNPNPLPPEVPTFWAFVDLEKSRQAVFIIPDEEIRREIYEGHQSFLNRHNGQRPVNNASNHHSLAVNRIEKWRDRWDLLGLEDSGATGA